MINALTAYNMTMEAIKFNENIWNIIAFCNFIQALSFVWWTRVRLK